MIYKRNFRFYITLWIVKVIALGMRLIGRPATYLPGNIALKLCPTFLGQIQKPSLVVAVTGTNGKTTVCNMIDDILEENGYRLINNRYGSNVAAGVVSAMISGSNLRGACKKDIAVLEVDERSSLRIYPYLQPDYILCTNLFRDSIRRNAHAEFISYVINKGIPSTTTLILNGDDLISSGLGQESNKKIFFGIHQLETDSTKIGTGIRDIINCPRCDTRLEYQYIRYNHIGKAFCPLCGFHSPECDYFVTDISQETQELTIAQYGKEYTYRMISDHIVNIYNMVASIALLSELGLSPETLQHSFQHIEPVKSRFNSESYKNVNIIMHLAKGQNPIACSRVFEYAAKDSGKKAILLNLDDKFDSQSNSENPAWFYEADYSPLGNESFTQLIIAGKRRYDQYLRLLMAGVPAERIFMTEHEADSFHMLDFNRIDKVYILYDVYTVDTAEKIKASIKERLDREVQL